LWFRLAAIGLLGGVIAIGLFGDLAKGGHLGLKAKGRLSLLAENIKIWNYAKDDGEMGGVGNSVALNGHFLKLAISNANWPRGGESFFGVSEVQSLWEGIQNHHSSFPLKYLPWGSTSIDTTEAHTGRSSAYSLAVIRQAGVSRNPVQGSQQKSTFGTDKRIRALFGSIGRLIGSDQSVAHVLRLFSHRKPLEDSDYGEYSREKGYEKILHRWIIALVVGIGGYCATRNRGPIAGAVGACCFALAMFLLFVTTFTWSWGWWL